MITLCCVACDDFEVELLFPIPVHVKFLVCEECGGNDFSAVIQRD